MAEKNENLIEGTTEDSDTAMSEGEDIGAEAVLHDSAKENSDVIFNDGKKPAENNGVVFNDGQTGRKPRYTPTEEVHTAQEPAKEKGKVKRIVINSITIFLSVIMLLAGSALVVYYTGFLGRINYNNLSSEDKPVSSQKPVSKPNSSKPTQSQGTVSGISETPAPNLFVGDLLDDDMVLNILVFGSDTRTEGNYGNSDTMLLVSIDSRHKKLKITSFMRDLYVNIPGYGGNKLNAAYSFGGPKLSIETIQQNFGIKIDRYAVVDFKSFTNIIDKLGGIDIKLTDEEIDYINWQCWKNNQVSTRNEITAKAGVVHLNGRQALWHSRNRTTSTESDSDDWARTSRQRDVFEVVLNDVKKVDVSTLFGIIFDIGPMITTNLKSSEITTLATNSPTYFSYETSQYNITSSENWGKLFRTDDLLINGEPLNCVVIDDWDTIRRNIAVYIYEDSVV